MEDKQKTIYALCRSYEPFGEKESDEYQIVLGINPEPLMVTGYNLFSDDRKAPVARLEIIGRGNGTVIASITDCLKQEIVNREIPIDDLVKEEHIAGSIRKIPKKNL